MKLNHEIRVLDLAQEPEEINRFITNTLKWDVEIQSLLRAFAEEMKSSSGARRRSHHYLPCQHLADYIRDAHDDGIRYSSALSPEATNVIFFDPGVADGGESKLVRIAETTLRYEEERVRSVAQQLGEAVRPRPQLDPNDRAQPRARRRRREADQPRAARRCTSESRRTAPKSDATIPVPSGSGNKYKRCCGGR